MAISQSLHLGNKLDPVTLETLADFICGDIRERYPIYRSSSYLTMFFQSVGINATHDGSTRKWWTLEILKQLEPSDLEKIILRLVNLKEYRGDRQQLKLAVISMNNILLMENLAIGFENLQPILQRAKQIDLSADELLREGSENENDFLNKQFTDDIQIALLKLDGTITSYLQSRVNELQSCPKNKVPLGSIFLLGSTLEGLLLAIAVNNLPEFMKSTLAPQDKNGKIKSIYDWKLSQLIDVAHDTGFIRLDVKKFSHILRDFRNYIHPYQQMSQNFNPDQHTVDICWQVFKAAFSQLKSKIQ